jgi:hypothetical protein
VAPVCGFPGAAHPFLPHFFGPHLGRDPGSDWPGAPPAAGGLDPDEAGAACWFAAGALPTAAAAAFPDLGGAAAAALVVAPFLAGGVVPRRARMTNPGSGFPNGLAILRLTAAEPHHARQVSCVGSVKRGVAWRMGGREDVTYQYQQSRQLHHCGRMKRCSGPPKGREVAGSYRRMARVCVMDEKTAYVAEISGQCVEVVALVAGLLTDVSDAGREERSRSSPSWPVFL